MAKTFRESLNEQLKDSEFKNEWESLEPEYQVMRAMVKTRKEKGITQKDLSDITGINQADISRLENGTANPSLSTLKRLASGLGLALKLEFVPEGNYIK